MRLSYSFRKVALSKKVPATTQPHSSWPKKKTASQELASQAHQKAHIKVILKSSTFRLKTSLTPQSAQILNSFNNTPTSPIHTLNFTVASKVSPATMSSSIVHATGEFQPQTALMEPPLLSHTNQHPIDTIMEMDREWSAGYRMGMENRFENSPMASLLQQFSSEDVESQGLSTKTKIQLIIDVVEMGLEMIMDRGPEWDDSLPHYHLTHKDLDRVQDTVTELQIFLQRAANLIEECKTHFLVDPGDTLLLILAGTSSLGQLNAAWKALRLHIKLGAKAWEKYITKYQQLSNLKLTLSPTSTHPDLYNDLDRIESSKQKLRYMYSNILIIRINWQRRDGYPYKRWGPHGSMSCRYQWVYAMPSTSMKNPLPSQPQPFILRIFQCKLWIKGNRRTIADKGQKNKRDNGQ